MSGNGEYKVDQLRIANLTYSFSLRTEIDITNEQRWFKDGMSEEDIDALELGEEHH
jgi:hypothetical protein